MEFSVKIPLRWFCLTLTLLILCKALYVPLLSAPLSFLYVPAVSALLVFLICNIRNVWVAGKKWARLVLLLCLLLLLPLSRWYEQARFAVLRDEMETAAKEYIAQYHDRIKQGAYRVIIPPLEKWYLTRGNNLIIMHNRGEKHPSGSRLENKPDSYGVFFYQSNFSSGRSNFGYVYDWNGYKRTSNRFLETDSPFAGGRVYARDFPDKWFCYCFK